MIPQLVNLTCRKALPAHTVCTKLGLSDKELRSLVSKASDQGFTVRLVDGVVSSKAPAVLASGIVPELGDTRPGRKKVALITDIHFGSKHTARKQLIKFLRFAWVEGCRVCVVTGDILDGNREVLLHDQSKIGFDHQVEDAISTFRKACPFEYVAIDGNHDGYFSSSAGMLSGRLLEAEARAYGLKWHYSGACLGRAKIHGAKWQLWHPHGGASTRNAIRRVLNSRIESLDEPCDVLAMGHFHKFATVSAYPEEVFGIAGGCWQMKGSEFSNRIAGSWDVGGAIVSYDLDKGGRVSHVSGTFYPASGTD